MNISPIRMSYVNSVSFKAKVNGREVPDQYIQSQYQATVSDRRSLFGSRAIDVTRYIMERGQGVYVNDAILDVRFPKGFVPFSGSKMRTYNGQIVDTTSYRAGVKSSVTEYKNNKPYKTTEYDYQGKINGITDHDSGISIRKSGLNENEIQMMQSASGVELVCTFRQADDSISRGQGKFLYEEKQPAMHHRYTAEINFNDYGHVTYECVFDDQLGEEAKEALKELQKMIKKPEYKKIFGGNTVLNKQMAEVIKYLEKNY